MNNNYFSSSSNGYSFEYPSPSAPTYYNSPSFTTCPVHSPHMFYLSPSQSMNISPFPYSYYYQQQQPQVFSPPIQQHATIRTDADRTPLRRHHCFKKNELQILHQAYMQDSHPPMNIIQQLAIQLKVPPEKVRQWFKNRRHSDKQKNRATARASTTTITN